MSTEEQEAAIGRLALERSEARRVCALLGAEIGKFKERLGNLSVDLGRMDNQEYLDKATGQLDSLIVAGGLDELKAKLSEHRALNRRIGEISIALRNAGMFD